MPLNPGAFKLGSALAGNSGMARIAGEKAGGEYALTSANTQLALEKAKSARIEALAAQRQQDSDDQFADSLVTTGVAKSRDEGIAMAHIARGGYAKYDDLVTGRGKLREQGHQDTLADDLAPMPARLAASSALKKEVVSPFQTVPDEYVDMRNPDAGVQTSPNTRSQITERDTKLANPEKYRQERQTPEEIRAAAEARAMGTGGAKRELDRPQARARFEAFNDKQDEISSRATALGSDENLWKAVGAAKTLAEIPGTEGATIRARINTLVAKLTVQAVQEARDLSKTGGAYGNTNAREWEDIGQSAAAINNNMAPSAAREELLALADRVELSLHPCPAVVPGVVGAAGRPDARVLDCTQWGRA